MAAAELSEFQANPAERPWDQPPERLLARIAETIGPIRCELWFGEPGAVVWNEAGVQFRFASEFAMNRVLRQAGAELKRAVESLVGSPTPIQFLVVPGRQRLSPTAPSSTFEQGRSPGGGDASEALPDGSPTIREPKTREMGREQVLPALSAEGVSRVLPSGQGPNPAAGDRQTDRREGAISEANQPRQSHAEGGQSEASGAREGKSGIRLPGPSQSRFFTWENFWFGSENQLVESAIRANFSGTGHFSPLLIHGPTGSGKTHLLKAVCRRFRALQPQRRCVCLTGEEFLNEFVCYLKKSGLPMFRRKFRDLDLLAIDDLHYLAGKSATINELNSTLELLIREEKYVVLTTHRQPQELFKISPELTARLQSGLNCPLRYPEFEGRRQILATVCNQRGWRFAGEVLDLIAAGVEADCRRLSGALNRLRAAELASGQPANRESAERDLRDLFAIGQAMTTLPRIEQLVCQACGIPPAQLRSESRKKKTSAARMLAMWLSRRHTSKALSEIGDYFGGRSHSTVVAAEKRVQHWLDSGEKIELENGVFPVSDAVQLLARRLRVG